MNLKQQYRGRALRLRRALSAEERSAASVRIRDVLLFQLEQRKLLAAPLLIYRAMEDEVDTRQLLDMDRDRMFAPVVHSPDAMQWRETGPNTCWETGKFNVEEPVSGRLWEPRMGKSVLICPLVGFDRSGNRLGLGTGCFDRWLEQFAGHLLTTIGLAFSCQEAPVIPVEDHDVPLDVIITEREIIECRKY